MSGRVCSTRSRENLPLGPARRGCRRRDTVLVLEHMELALSEVPRAVASGGAVDRGLGIVGTMLEEEAPARPLARRVQLSSCASRCRTSWSEMLLGLRARCRTPPCGDRRRCGARRGRTLEALEGCQPAKAVALLDAACARAVLASKGRVEPTEVYSAAAGFSRPGGAAGRQPV